MNIIQYLMLALAILAMPLYGMTHQQSNDTHHKILYELTPKTPSQNQQPPSLLSKMCSLDNLSNTLHKTACISNFILLGKGFLTNFYTLKDSKNIINTMPPEELTSLLRLPADHPDIKGLREGYKSHVALNKTLSFLALSVGTFVNIGTIIDHSSSSIALNCLVPLASTSAYTLPQPFSDPIPLEQMIVNEGLSLTALMLSMLKKVSPTIKRVWRSSTKKLGFKPTDKLQCNLAQSDDDVICPICREEYDGIGCRVKLECSHKYCPSCLMIRLYGEQPEACCGICFQHINTSNFPFEELYEAAHGLWQKKNS